MSGWRSLPSAEWKRISAGTQSAMKTAGQSCASPMTAPCSAATWPRWSRPGDIHNHGHVLGTGPSPYSLILLGDNMYLFERTEYDPDQGTWRTLAPGDPGRPHR